MFIHRISLNERFTPSKIHGKLEAVNPREIRKLWRIDEIASKQYLLVVSELARLNADDLGTIQTKSYSEFLKKINAGQRWHFRLTANPIISRNEKTADGKRKQMRMPLTIGGQADWLKKRLENNGFSVEKVMIVKNERLEFRKADRKIVSLSVAEFEGTLEIKDKKAACEALIKGIGHGKAYGCGLLTLAKNE
jgi:CRISPR system Cascade subunit CasE